LTRVSVIVPTKARPELLRRCLVALINQSFDRSAYEIIVADDGPDAETRRVVESVASLAARVPKTNGTQSSLIRYVPVFGSHGPAAARNAGLRMSRGEIVAFTDDDCIPGRDWLQAGCAVFVDGIAGASGRVVVPVSKRPTDYELNASRLELSEFVTANCFYRKKALLAIGGFDEQFSDAWREDSDLFFRLLKKQTKLVSAPDAVVVHPVRPASWGISLVQQRKNLHNALLYKKHKDLYRERLKPIVPWHYYLAVTGLIMAVSFSISGNRAAATVSLGVWLAVTLVFFFRRIRKASLSPSHILEMLVTSVLIPPVSIFWRLVGAVKYRVPFL
jgi:glycosyltransferase involved in cell wall biosynthesis